MTMHEPKILKGSLRKAMEAPVLTEKGLFSYWGAEFGFPTCPAFSEGVMECAREGFYPFMLQSEAYNERVLWWMEQVRKSRALEAWIVPTHGTIFALATAIRLLVSPSEHLLMITPGYSRYKQAADRLHRRTELCPMDYDPESGAYSLNLSLLEKQMKEPGCRLLVFSNPNNPTGKILSKEELSAIARLGKACGVTIFCDEIFGEIVLSGERVVPFFEAAGEEVRSITATSLGKCMGLTGVNHANLFIPEPELREAYIAAKYADHYGSIDPMLYAGLIRAYTEEGARWLKGLIERLRINRSLFAACMAEVFPKAKIAEASGTFLAWVDYSALDMDDAKLKAHLEERLLYGASGEEFFASGQFMRYSLALPTEGIQRSFDVIRELAL